MLGNTFRTDEVARSSAVCDNRRRVSLALDRFDGELGGMWLAAAVAGAARNLAVAGMWGVCHIILGLECVLVTVPALRARSATRRQRQVVRGCGGK